MDNIGKADAEDHLESSAHIDGITVGFTTNSADSLLTQSLSSMASSISDNLISDSISNGSASFYDHTFESSSLGASSQAISDATHSMLSLPILPSTFEHPSLEGDSTGQQEQEQEQEQESTSPKQRRVTRASLRRSTAPAQNFDEQHDQEHHEEEYIPEEPQQQQPQVHEDHLLPAIPQFNPTTLVGKYRCESCEAILGYTATQLTFRCPLCSHFINPSEDPNRAHNELPLDYNPTPTLREQAELWNVAQVGVFLDSLGLRELVTIFAANFIDGRQLLNMTAFDILEELNLDKKIYGDGNQLIQLLAAVNVLRGVDARTGTEELAEYIRLHRRLDEQARKQQAAAARSHHPNGASLDGGESARKKIKSN